MEGWTRIRIAGQTDWKRFYMVISSGSASVLKPELSRTGSVADGRGSPNAQRSSKRISNLFSRDSTSGIGGGSAGPLPLKPIVSLYSGNKAKDRKVAVLSMREVTQAFAVYPERPELINVSPLIKLEGLLGDEITAGGMRSREAWLMLMPEMEGRTGQSAEMLRWVMGEHCPF